jgi:hypothetical protein
MPQGKNAAVLLWRYMEDESPEDRVMMRRIVLGLFVASLVLNTGCFMRRGCGQLNKSSRSRGQDVGIMSGCNECSSYSGTEMFGTPMHGNSAGMYQPYAGMYQPPVDERLNPPAKQTPYEGPAKK